MTVLPFCLFHVRDRVFPSRPMFRSSFHRSTPTVHLSPPLCLDMEEPHPGDHRMTAGEPSTATGDPPTAAVDPSTTASVGEPRAKASHAAALGLDSGRLGCRTLDGERRCSHGGCPRHNADQPRAGHGRPRQSRRPRRRSHVQTGFWLACTG